jgi:hypothetical protein
MILGVVEVGVPYDLLIVTPAVANGVVYVGSYDGSVYALNANTGAKLWSYPAQLPVEKAASLTDLLQNLHLRLRNAELPPSAGSSF